MNYEVLSRLFPLIIYFLLICLLIISIVLGIKAIITLGKVDKIIDNVNEKVESLNSLFRVIDFTKDKISSISERIIDLITGLFGKLLFPNKKNDAEEDQEDE